MTKNDFDPSKLNIDFTNLENHQDDASADDVLWALEKQAKDEVTKTQTPNTTSEEKAWESALIVHEDVLSSITTTSAEKKIDINTDKIDIDLLSTILTDSELRPEEVKKLDAEKNTFKETQIAQEQKRHTFDINLKSIDDLIAALQQEKYDFVVLEPNEEYVKVSFKKDSMLKETKYIKYHIYTQLLIEIKKLSKLNIEITNAEQKGSWEYKFRDLNLELLSKTTPSNFWEILYFKTKIIDKTGTKKVPIKKSISAGTAFWFLGAILFIALILGWVFLTFVIFNAKTPQDVSFFANLGINLNDVNSFLLKVTTFVFSIVVLVEAIIFSITLFKALLTKKELKRKKTIFTIVSIILLIFTFSTGTLWMSLDKAIKNLPNWLEMSYGNVQIFDNELLKSPNFDKANALITDFTSIIGPVELKFDLTYLQKDEMRRWFEIKKYIWDFGDGEKLETQTPNIIQSFDKKGNYKINLTLEGIDARFPSKITQKPAMGMPTLSIQYVVKITQNTLKNGGKTVSFDASDLKPLGDIEWYQKEDLTKPAYTGLFFQPSKVYFEEEYIGMLIRNGKNENNYMNRVFVISGEKSNIEWDIKYEVSADDDLNYTLQLEKIENSFWDGFIKSFKWTLEDKEISKEADILNLEESSKINYQFQNYGKQIITVLITNSAGKSKEIKKEINIPKQLKLKNQVEFYENGNELVDIKYDEKTHEYTLYEIGVPTQMKFDAKMVRADNPLYQLQEITWDIWNNGSIESKEKSLEHTFELPWWEDIGIKYKFVHRKDPKDIIEIKENINIELIEKEATLVLDVKSESEYAPTIVKVDWSLSKVIDDNIVKFIYDYGDGVVEERDAKNAWHKYLKEWNYKIKMTVVTEKGKEYSISKSLILKWQVSEVKISVSMRSAPVWQEIDFLSSDSIGQIVWYHWDFNDGNISNEANPSHAFEKPGKYKVVLTVDYANNNVMSEEIEVEIIE